MKTGDVPSDKGFLEEFRRGACAVDEQGQYRLVATPGWSAETTATAAALEEQDRHIRLAFEDVKAGRKSTLAYHLARRMLTPALLASYARVSRLRVWWHLRPNGLAGISPSLARRYAECLQTTPEELARLPDAPESLL